ncbi:MAG: RNA polymerase sigma factor [Prosthecobacter sp.]
MTSHTSPPAAQGLFPTTNWAGLRGHAQSHAPWTEVKEGAMSHLYLAYARPLQVFLRQRGRNELEAEELVHGFFAHAMTRDLLRHARQQQETRFRTYLLASLTHWLSDQRRRVMAQKRGGNTPHQPLHGDQDTLGGLDVADEGEDVAASQAYDREWAQTMVSQAMQALKEGYEKRGRGPLFAALRGILPGGGETRPYAEIASDLEMTEPAVRKAAHQLRAACAEFLRAEVARTLAEPEMVDEELRYLLHLLRTGG